ncbi:LysM repeat protein [Variovorax boronicumulans]|uniref:LysM peptidoglycan-binding domain-containing protein n=1 Tax=Variovorax boronicumulans TaxID=436515 RepID=UPI0024764A83|nr:LysM peptidoglycan-binding domain-containing protein [Variovorax boronicumulans]MDH6168206.1 LysM repeat protein [Variovorax boronicumulans]
MTAIMPKLISATYHPNIEVAEFICEDGRRLLRHGGTLPWRINNPGDLTALLVDGKPAPKKAKGYVGFATTRSGRIFLIFPDEISGRTELKANLKRMHGDRTIPEAIPFYAPKNENNTQKYIDDLLKSSKVAADKKIGTCSEAEIENIVDSIAKIEGYHASPETRKETWVTVSTINATDGTQPLPEVEIILEIGGQSNKVKSNSAGRFPLVIHPADKKPVHVSVVDQKSKKTMKVGSIKGDTGNDFNLLAKFRKWKGIAGSEKFNSSTQGQKKPMRYVVQPGDNLGKIAKIYRSTVAAIKDENNLDSDRIYPGETLSISSRDREKSLSAPAKLDAHASKPTAPIAAKKIPHPVFVPAPPIPISTQPSDSERSKEGTGKILALINPLSGRAPWMPIAIAEAKLRRGEHEAKIEKKISYHVEIDDGLKSLDGPRNAWCAAFVNWCLMQAKYPIENSNFPNRRAAKGRAHGFYEVSGPKEKSEAVVIMIRNPLFVELDKPIYGAIAMVTSKSNHGHHVGFVYAKHGDKKLILLGGNQDSQINFSPFNINAVAGYTRKNKDGKSEYHKGNPNHLKFFVPTAYYEQAKKDLSDPGLENLSAAEINKSMGIETDNSNSNRSPSTT